MPMLFSAGRLFAAPKETERVLQETRRPFIIRCGDR